MFYFLVDISEHVMSLARATRSRSRVTRLSKDWRSLGVTPVTRARRQRLHFDAPSAINSA